MIDPLLDRLIRLALEEDLGSPGDVTSNALIGRDDQGSAELWTKEAMVISGLGAFARVFELVDPQIRVVLEAADGQWSKGRRRIAAISGSLRGILAAERTALNIIQRTCGIATLTREAVRAVRGTRLRILDTRKTPPGMRGLAKAAVLHGGAHNHRWGLFDGVLIKDNHIMAAGGSVREALRRAKSSRVAALTKVEIEVATIDQLREALDEGADIIMLDNMNNRDIARAVKIADGRAVLEVSGGVSADRLKVLARLGVDCVSMGALTHSARAMDLSLEVVGTNVG